MEVHSRRLEEVGKMAAAEPAAAAAAAAADTRPSGAVVALGYVSGAVTTVCKKNAAVLRYKISAAEVAASAALAAAEAAANAVIVYSG